MKKENADHLQLHFQSPHEEKNIQNVRFCKWMSLPTLPTSKQQLIKRM
jgi:hypothetical protein